MTELERGALQVDIKSDDGTVSAVIAHLKSKLLSFVDGFGNSSFQPATSTSALAMAPTRSAGARRRRRRSART